MVRYCETCKVEVPARGFTGHLRSLQHKEKVCEPWEVPGVMLLSQAFKNRIASYRIEGCGGGVDVREFHEKAEPKVIHLLESATDKFSNVKVNMELFGLYTLPSKNVTEVKSFLTKNSVVTIATNFTDCYRDMFAELHKKMQDFEEADSGWALVKLMFLEVNICKMK